MQTAVRSITTFKGVKLGDIGLAYYVAQDVGSRLSSTWLEMLPADLSEAKGEVWTKQNPFVQAQGYPRPTQHHQHCRGCNEGKNAWMNRQAHTDDVRQTLKISPSRIYEEEWLVDHDVVSDGLKSLGDDWNDHEQAYTAPSAEAVEERNNKIAGDLLDRAERNWERSRRCDSLNVPLSVITPAPSSPPTSWTTLGDTSTDIAIDGAWELLPLL